MYEGQSRAMPRLSFTNDKRSTFCMERWQGDILVALCRLLLSEANEAYSQSLPSFRLNLFGPALRSPTPYADLCLVDTASI